MKDRTLTNSLGAFRTVTDHRLFIDANGLPLDLETSYIEVPANAAIIRGAPVIFVVPTATVPLRCAGTGAGAVGATVRGIAMNAATAAGQLVQVCVHGFCFVSVADAPTAAAAFGTWGISDPTEAAKVDSSSAALDATTVVGSILGMFLGAEAADELAPFWYEHF